ncbi:MAG: glycosyltransferase [Acidobacteria bacterium]|nr:glycosyltransferase [Acidobacteriota bacterium]
MNRALLISTENPFPADSGGRLRLRGILDVLTRHFSIDMVTYERPENAALDEARSRLNIVQVPRTVTPRSAALRSLYRRRTLGYMGHADIDMMDSVRALCARESYDSVFIDNTMLGYFIPRLRRLQPSARFVTIAHNHETSLCRQMANAQQGLARRALFAWSALHTQRAETRVCRDTDLLLSTSQDEANSFAALCPDVADRTVVVPSCIDAASYEGYGSRPTEGESIVFSGDMAYFPNVAAARHFHAQVFPLLKVRRPGIRLRLVGRNPHPSIVEMASADPAVEVTGAVPDAAAEVVKSAVVIVPLLHGSGTRLKILEAWAVDRPVVTTPKGCEGIACRHNHDLVIAVTPADFVDAICRLLDDPRFAAALARHARETLLSRYDVRSLDHSLVPVMNGAADVNGETTRVPSLVY